MFQERSKKSSHNGQSLVEFAVLLPAVLTLILLIVRMMMILNTWYTLTSAAEIAVRAAALTGNAAIARQIVLDNMPGADPAQLSITFQPDLPTFGFPPTVTPLPSVTPNILAPIDPQNIPDYPIRISLVYNEQIAGPLIPTWTLRLSANATARLETRIKLTPMRYF